MITGNYFLMSITKMFDHLILSLSFTSPTMASAIFFIIFRFFALVLPLPAGFSFRPPVFFPANIESFAKKKEK